MNKTTPHETLAERLYRLKQNRDLTYREIGEAIGYSVGNAHDIIKGIRGLSLNTALTLARLFGMKLDDLLYRTEFDPYPDVEKLPPALSELINSPEFGQFVTPSMVGLLSKLEYEGRRPMRMVEYLRLLYILDVDRWE